MAELYPLPLGHLLKRIFHESKNHKAVFDLPTKTFYKAAAGLDTSVFFHGMRAASAIGPAAGPQDQLVQNVVLSWLGGSRIMELKTIQIMDELKIPRPCIDATNIGFNVEWSQELKLDVSLEEYVKTSMVLDILQASDFLELGERAADLGQVILDMSVGYDLNGISSPPVRRWIETMLDATPIINRLRKEIPDEYKQFRDFDFHTRIANSVTLSTFHGCPPDEIEKIVHFLLTEIGVHSIIKLNPTQLGKEKLEHLLHDVMGYRHLEVNPKAYTSGLTLDEAIEILYRLEPFAKARDLGLGVKFSNTLETLNKTKGFFPVEEIMYMSGQPLHVIAMTLVDDFRKRVGMRFPITFSAGIDQFNFAPSAALGLCPITVCTDLLRPQGYARQFKYVKKLEDEMQKRGTTCMDDYTIKWGNNAEAAVDTALNLLRHALRDEAAVWPESPYAQWGPLYQAHDGEAHTRSVPPLKADEEAYLGKVADALKEALLQPKTDVAAVIPPWTGAEHGEPPTPRLANAMKHLRSAIARAAAERNTSDYVAALHKDPRYFHDANKSIPKRVGTYLYLFDCISCDKCVPVCPNDANFIYEVPPVTLEYRNWKMHNGTLCPSERGVFKIEKAHQLANFADFCNECGNCDVFCPEYGGPFIEKPRFFSTLETWKRHSDRDGFYAEKSETGDVERVWGRIQEREYFLERGSETAEFSDGAVVVQLKREDRSLVSHRLPNGPVEGHVVDMLQYHRMDAVLTGVLNPSRVHFANAHYLTASTPVAEPV